MARLSWPPNRAEFLTIKVMNRRYVAWILQETHGNMVLTAKILGINLSTLYRWTAR